MSLFVIHPRIEGALRISPSRSLWVRPEGLGLHIEASTSPVEGYVHLTTLDYLLQYDFRGSNRYQEEENLEFLRLYLEKYPEIRQQFRTDILRPTEWDEEYN